MDIEGAEQRALLGARQTIQRFRPRMALASYHLADDVEMIPQLVEQARDDYGMTCYRCLPFRGFLLVCGRPELCLNAGPLSTTASSIRFRVPCIYEQEFRGLSTDRPSPPFPIRGTEQEIQSGTAAALCDRG